MGLNNRLNRLERSLPGADIAHVVMWWIDPDVHIPAWAYEAVRPLLPKVPGGVTIAEWRGDEGGGLVASWDHCGNKVAYTVTPDGCEPVESSR